MSHEWDLIRWDKNGSGRGLLGDGCDHGDDRASRLIYIYRLVSRGTAHHRPERCFPSPVRGAGAPPSRRSSPFNARIIIYLGLLQARCSGG